MFQNSEAVAHVLQNSYSWKFHNILRKTPVLESLFNRVAVNVAKYYCEYCEFFEKNFFYRTPPVDGSGPPVNSN